VSDSALPSFPTIRFPWGAISELNYGSLALRPVELFAPQADPTKHLCSANGGFYFRASGDLVSRSTAGYCYRGNWASSTGGSCTR
jgi:hypothetical protein